MTCNMGKTDRMTRAFVVAPLLVIVGLLVGPTTVLAIVLYVLAAVMLGTSAIGYCPLYAPFHFRTTPKASVDA